MTARLLLITRPEEGGRALAAQLNRPGLDALWIPAFDILPPPDPAALAQAVDHLASYDLVVFVSPTAAGAFARAMRGEWPAATAIAAVGQGSFDALAAIAGVQHARRYLPDGSQAAEGGSEALWKVLGQVRPAPRRVLIVRAQAGRQWLADRLQEAGAQVDHVAAYQRRTHAPDDGQREALAAACTANAPLAVLYTSSEAVDTVRGWFGAGQPAAWLARSLALSVHERIAQRLRAAGCTYIQACDPNAASIRGTLDAVNFVPLQP